MISRIKQDGQGLCEFVVDSAADVAALPTSCDMGSSALVIETGDVYMLGGNKLWTKVGG